MNRFRIDNAPIDSAAVEALVGGNAYGAVATFAGIVRERADDGRPVTGLSYQAHATMAVDEFERIADEAVERFGDCTIAIVHRVGELDIGEIAVVVAVGAVHRAGALDACRYCIDQLKARAPIWKREAYADGSARWQENCASGEVVE
jgi:molybdopterin synthase catalytic subunit